MGGGMLQTPFDDQRPDAHSAVTVIDRHAVQFPRSRGIPIRRGLGVDGSDAHRYLVAAGGDVAGRWMVITRDGR